MIRLVDGKNFYASCERALDPALIVKVVAVLSWTATNSIRQIYRG